MSMLFQNMKVALKEVANQDEWNITDFALNFYEDNSYKNQEFRKYIDHFMYDFQEWEAINRLLRFFSMFEVQNWNSKAIGSLLIQNLPYFVGSCKISFDNTELKPECQYYIDALNKLFTMPGETMSLPDAAFLFSAIEPNQVLEESINSLESIEHCLRDVSEEHIEEQKEAALMNLEILQDNVIINFTSPCFEIEKYPQCSAYCSWHNTFLSQISRKEFLTIMKYALPQRKFVLDHLTDEKNLAAKLFGKGSIKASPFPIAPKTNIYLCHQMEHGFLGDLISNASYIKACNEFFPNPSDIGMCLTKNVNIKKNREVAEEYDILLETKMQKPVNRIAGGNLWSKTTLVLIPDFNPFSSSQFKRQSLKREEKEDLQNFIFHLHPSEEFPKTIHGTHYSKKSSAIKLKAGHAYYIEVTPTGQMSTKAYKGLDVTDRNCLQDNEVDQSSAFKIYKHKNCLYECHSRIAKMQCNCTPWDFMPDIDTKECDIFGRYCFFKVMKVVAQSKDNHHCKECLEDCDSVEYNKFVKEVSHSSNIFFYDENKILNKFLDEATSEDVVDPFVLEIFNYTKIGPNENYFNDLDSKFKEAIIVEIIFLKPEMKIIDVKYSIFDKFANFGGNFGIFAEITGCSFLGMLNFIILFIKLLFFCCNNHRVNE